MSATHPLFFRCASYPKFHTTLVSVNSLVLSVLLTFVLALHPSHLLAELQGQPVTRQSLPQVPVLLGSVAQITAGYWHTCALTTVEGVKCWGYDKYGQLGVGTEGNTTTAMDVVGLTSGVIAVAAGGFASLDSQFGPGVQGHTCVLTTSSEVKCWGENSSGQLGDATTTDSRTPVDVVGLSSDVAALTLGYYHTCVLTTSGGIKCWGSNYKGQLGDGSFEDRSTPVDVVGLTSGVKAIAAAGSHTCAVTTDGGVKCWGSNYSGQLGDGSSGDGTDKAIPADVMGLSSGGTAIAAGGSHTCAVTTDEGVKCWGSNYSGQLGDGTFGDGTDKAIPVDVVGLDNGVAAISSGGNHTCVLITDGNVKCWGDNDSGQLGDGTFGDGTDKATPVDVVGLGNEVAAISAGESHTCGLTTDGGIKCWGYNVQGQLGNGGTMVRKSIPVDAMGLSSSVTAIAAGGQHTCALTLDRGVKCWGENFSGQLGDGTILRKSTQVDVIGLDVEVAAFATGSRHTCALAITGAVKCWGSNSSGQLGDGTTESKSTPVDVVGLDSGVAAISAGGNHTCAMTTDGGVKCWGGNYFGELGDGTTESKSTPVDVVGLSSGAIAISAGENHICTMTTDGGVKCWGYGGYGQLGDDTTVDRSTPVDVIGLTSGVAAISAGGRHSCVVTTDGRVKCWGRNSFGQLGDDTSGAGADKTVPVDVVGLGHGIASVAAGDNHTCAVTTGRGIKCWGNNGSGQLGDGTMVNKRTPVDVVGLGSGVIAITAGGYEHTQTGHFPVTYTYGHTCALTTGSEVKCWGYGGDGQLGAILIGIPLDVVRLSILDKQIFLPEVQR